MIVAILVLLPYLWCLANPLILPNKKRRGILASWFGTQVDWRQQHYPVYYNQLPNQHSIVFATNKQRPNFLNTHANVNAPTIELVSHPTDPYVKLLLVMGRDDNDINYRRQWYCPGTSYF